MFHRHTYPQLTYTRKNLEMDIQEVSDLTTDNNVLSGTTVFDSVLFHDMLLLLFLLMLLFFCCERYFRSDCCYLKKNAPNYCC